MFDGRSCTILTENLIKTNLIARNKISEFFDGIDYKMELTSGGNPARVLCSRSDLKNFVPKTKPLNHLQKTLSHVISEVAKSLRLRESVQDVPMRAKKRFKFSKVDERMDFDVAQIVQTIKRTDFYLSINSSDW